MGVLGILFRDTRVTLDPIGESRNGFFGQLKGSALDALNMGLTGIVIDATVKENHVSECDITKNPVEDGAKVTDHVQMNPARLTIEGVISDTPLGFAFIGNIQNLVRSVTTIFGSRSRSQDAYDDMLKLQKSKRPFTVITNLRKYDNMIMTSLSVPRTSQTGGAIHFTAELEEIVIVMSEEVANLSVTAKDIGAKTKNAGQKVTVPVPAEAQVANKSKSVLQKYRDAVLRR